MVNRKKVLYLITKSVWGGAGKYVYELALEAKELGFDVAVAAGGQGELAHKLKEKSIRYFDVAGLQRDAAFLKPFISGIILLKILFKFRPDIVHANSPQAAGIGGIGLFIYRLLTWKRRVQVVYTIHGWSFHEARPEWQNFLIRIFSKITCLFYQKIICVSDYDLRSALKFKIAPAKKLLTIHNGISSVKLNFLPHEEARQKLNLSNIPGSTFVFGTVGEFTKNKGQKYLIEAVALLKAKSYQAMPAGRQVKAVLIGWGEEFENLKFKIKNFGIADDILFKTDLSPASPYLKAFDIFILPSLKEGLPYTLLEAGLAELPVVATNVGGIPEIIENEKTGLLVNSANADGLAKAVSRLINDKNLRKKLGENLREKILKDFPKQEMLERTFSLYK